MTGLNPPKTLRAEGQRRVGKSPHKGLGYYIKCMYIYIHVHDERNLNASHHKGSVDTWFLIGIAVFLKGGDECPPIDSHCVCKSFVCFIWIPFVFIELTQFSRLLIQSPVSARSLESTALRAEQHSQGGKGGASASPPLL